MKLLINEIQKEYNENKEALDAAVDFINLYSFDANGRNDVEATYEQGYNDAIESVLTLLENAVGKEAIFKDGEN